MHTVLFFNQPPRLQAFNVQEFMCTALTCTFSNAVIGLNLFFQSFHLKLSISADKAERAKLYGACTDIGWPKPGTNEIQ